MKELLLLALCTFCFFLGFCTGALNRTEQKDEQAITCEKKLATKELQITLLQTGYEECRSIVTELKPIIEPRPLK